MTFSRRHGDFLQLPLDINQPRQSKLEYFLTINELVKYYTE